MALFCTKCGQELAEDARFCSRCGTALISDSAPEVVEEDVSPDEVEQIENEIWLVQEAAKKGSVTDDNIKRACALFRKIDRTRNARLLTNPEFKEIRETLERYRDVAGVLEYFNQRWNEDRQKGYRSKRQEKLVIFDYHFIARDGVFNLLRHLGGPFLSSGRNEISLGLGFVQLLEYFDKHLLEDLFVALLADLEDPKAYKEAFAGVKGRYNKYNPEGLLKKLTRSY